MTYSYNVLELHTFPFDFSISSHVTTTDVVNYVLIMYDGTVTYIEPVIYTSSCIMDLWDFPYDTQVCHLTWGSWGHSTDELKLVSVSFYLFFYHSFISHRLENRMKPISTLYDGRCCWDSNPRVPGVTRTCVHPHVYTLQCTTVLQTPTVYHILVKVTYIISWATASNFGSPDE